MINKKIRADHHKLYKQIKHTWVGKRGLRANFLNRFRVKFVKPSMFWWEANALNTPKKDGLE